MNWQPVIPTWCWWLLLVGGVQQWRVSSLQGDLGEASIVGRAQAEKLGACRETRGNLLVQVGEQNQALADLRRAADERQDKSAQVQAEARQQAEEDYQAANRLQQERTGGDVCTAAEAVIDKELGL